MGSRNHSRKKHQSQQRKSQGPHKFAVDERVLCYEPDLKKARVLYDSKVLEVVERSDKGKIRVEYKIHFFGWNSSWDRYVAEDCVLKDTAENRDLQKDLKSKADVLIQSHLKKKKRKKTLTEILKEATAKDKSGKGTKVSTKNDDDSSNSSGSSDSSDQESSDDEDKPAARIFLTDRVKALLEQDYYNIQQKNMLVRIPAEVSVICVFEGYVKFIGFRELRKVIEQYKSFFIASGLHPAMSVSSGAMFSSSSANTKTASTSTSNKCNSTELLTEDIESIYKKVRQAQEIVHGLKIIFDYMLYQMLLYSVENDQYKSHRSMQPRMPDINCLQLIPQLPVPSAAATEEFGDVKKKHQKKGENDGEGASTSTKQNRAVPGTSRENSETLTKLRKHTKAAADDPMKSNSSSSNLLSKAGYEAWVKTVNKYINELKSWQMLPEECYQKEHPDPSMVYGLIHLLRFFVKLPEILTLMRIPRRKVRIIAHHVNQMIEHIQSSHVFSISRLYVSLPRYVYEEDQIRVAPAAATEEAKQAEVKVEGEKDWSQYCTKYHRSDVIERIKPPVAKVVEVPLSATGGTLEEHQLTIRTEAPLQAHFGRSVKEGKRTSTSEKSTTPAKATGKTCTTVVPENLEDIIKEEPISPPLPAPPKVATQHQKKPSLKTSASRSAPVLPMVRQVRKSAAHAAFKTAHMFASQQALTSRTIAASTLTSQETDDEPGPSKKRPLSGDAPVSESKRMTRTSEVQVPSNSSSQSKASGMRKSRQDQRPDDNDNEKSASESPPERRSSESPTRKSKDTRNSGEQVKQHRTHGMMKLSPVRSKEAAVGEKRHSSSEKPKSEAKRISSPRNSRSSSSTKDNRLSSKTPQKSTSPTSSIRLRSRSDERQLRSKGTLINALALPIQGSPRSAHPVKSEEDKSPRRRDSTGNRDCSTTNMVAARHSDPMLSRRTNKR